MHSDCRMEQEGITSMENKQKEYIGYTKDGVLPIKRGDRVLIKKYTTVYNKHYGDYVTLKNRTVKVHHIMPGCEVSHTDWERYYKEEIPNPYIKESPHGDVWWGNRYVVSNPRVCWAGKSGYWSEADINDVVKDTK